MSTLLYQKFFQSVADEMEQVEQMLFTELQSESDELYKAATHLISGGGKRLRPAFLLLSAKILREDISNLLPMSCAMELAHVGTLVHDDVVDASDLRRGLPTVRVLYGEKMSLYAGGFLFAHSLRIAGKYGNSEVLAKMIRSSCEICAGEILQLSEAFSPEQNLKNYLRRIRKKTALLISLSCELGAILAGGTEKEVTQLKKYGYNLGMAFQISDDMLDFSAKQEIIGKPVGSDIKNGLITLPLLYALENSEKKSELRQMINSGAYSDERSVKKIVKAVRDCGALEYSRAAAEKYIQHALKALENFPENAAKRDLNAIAQQIAKRKF